MTHTSSVAFCEVLTCLLLSHTNGLDIGGKHFLDGDSLVPKQLALPISKGGDGITDPRAIANAAFLGSWALRLQPWKETMEEASEKEALIGGGTTLSEHLFGLCRQSSGNQSSGNPSASRALGPQPPDLNSRLNPLLITRSKCNAASLLISPKALGPVEPQTHGSPCDFRD